MTWRPILEGAIREKALGIAEDVGEALRRPDLTWSPEPGGDGEVNASLAGGAAGLAILFAYLDAAGLGSGSDDVAVTVLDRAGDLIGSTPMDASFYGGFTGVAWATTHLVGRVLSEGEEDAAEEIDAEVSEVLGRSPWGDDYDLVSGLVGLGVYALERLPRPLAAGCLSTIVARLAELAEPADGGLTWHTAPELLPDFQRELCPDGYFNLGVAHGVPGVIALLGRACAAGVAESTARELLEGSVAWLHRQKRSGGSLFSAWVAPRLEPTDCRSAWCYGDPGIAAALLVAARSVGEAAWEREAIDIALEVSHRPVEKAGVVDAGLCHGAAGLGHVFNRMYQTTGNEELRAAAVLWLEKAMEMRRPGTGIAGYTSPWFDDQKKRRDWDDPALLTGATGVALALLAGATDVEPEWDRILLVS